MGIFSEFLEFTNPEKHIHPVVSEIYRKMGYEYCDILFYGDIESANQILTGMSEETFGVVNNERLALCNDIYQQTWLHTHGCYDSMTLSPEAVKTLLCQEYAGFDPQIINKCVDHAVNVIDAHEPDLFEEAELTPNATSFVETRALQNQAVENLFINDEEYGLVSHKPVFVSGFGGGTEYLSHLHAADGARLSYHRLGSMQVDGIAGSVDRYQLLHPDGSEYGEIYLCNYGTRTLENAPRNMQYI